MSVHGSRPSKDIIFSSINKLVHALVHISDDNGEFLMTLDDGRVIDTKGWNDWEWTHGIGLHGLMQLYILTQSPQTLAIMTNWFKARFAVGTTKNINTMSALLTAAHLHQRGVADYSVYLTSWADWAMHDLQRTAEDGFQHATYSSDHKGQIWADTLMMTALPLVTIGYFMGNNQYVEEGKRQFLLHAKYLSDPSTGLWFHAFNFIGRHHFARARWARGNCWITLSIPEVLELLSSPSKHPHSIPQLSRTDAFWTFLTGTLQAQIDALVDLQDESGLWHTLLDDPTSYTEASASAGFAAGILKALRLRLMPREERYIACARRAVNAILGHIGQNGELQQVSFGTPVFGTLEEYKEVKLTSMPYGQSLALLCLCEELRGYI